MEFMPSQESLATMAQASAEAIAMSPSSPHLSSASFSPQPSPSWCGVSGGLSASSLSAAAASSSQRAGARSRQGVAVPGPLLASIVLDVAPTPAPSRARERRPFASSSSTTKGKAKAKGGGAGGRWAARLRSAKFVWEFPHVWKGGNRARIEVPFVCVVGATHTGRTLRLELSRPAQRWLGNWHHGHTSWHRELPGADFTGGECGYVRPSGRQAAQAATEYSGHCRWHPR